MLKGILSGTLIVLSLTGCKLKMPDFASYATAILALLRPQTYLSLGGEVSGLQGKGLVLQNNGGDNLSISEDEKFSFPSKILKNKTYVVTVSSQPSEPWQTCSVTNGNGTATGNVTNVLVDCVSNSYKVSVTVSGLSSGMVSLQNNGGDNLGISSNGTFYFSQAIETGKPFLVTIFAQPSALVCRIANPSGTIGGGDVNVVVNCGATYSLGGRVTGLTGSNFQLQLSGEVTQETAIAPGSANYAFGGVPSGSYTVSIINQPINPYQTCVIANSSGTITTDLGNVDISCTTNFYSVKVNVTGLNAGTMFLQNNGGDNLSISSNGISSFATPVLSGSSYNVTIYSQAAEHNCSVSSPIGTMSGSDVTLTVNCTANTYTVGGSINNLLTSGLQLQLTGGVNDTISISSGSSSYTFSVPVGSGLPYIVSILSQPTGQNCAVSNGTGLITNSIITNVVVNCSPLVTSTTPAEGATSVALNQTISIQFNTAMLSATLTVQATDGACSGSIQLSATPA
ncbi:MAG: Ig-like domain-containing protein [Leptospiraceae bacterium]|nr:Ig-like domain-containing protein [Leptospiraceae bacterium]